jgi:hypothetical protein
VRSARIKKKRGGGALCKRKFDDVAVLGEMSLEELFEIRKENKYNDVKDDNHQIVKYTGDSGGIMSLTKFLMQPTLHFRNLLGEIKKKIQFGST